MPIFGAIIGGAVGLIGDAMSSSSASDTNASNQQINQMNINAAMDRQTQAEAYNAVQASVSRDFSAQQVAKQEEFQKSTLEESEAWDKMMSDTAMQRRVEDLKAAGLNPLLAASQQGASAPVVSGVQGNIANAAQASAGPAGQGSGIPMQNPGAAFGNLGGQITGAIQAAQTGANIDLMRAQANKLNAETGQEIPAQVEYLKSMTGLTNENAQVAAENIRAVSASVLQTQSQTELNNNLARFQGQRADIIKATRDALISAEQSDSTAKQLQLQGLRNLNDVQQGQFGKVITYLNAILQPIHTGASAAGNLLP